MINLDVVEIHTLIERALKEDLSDIGDVTSQAIFDKTKTSVFKLIAKQDGVLSGRYLFNSVLKRVDPSIRSKFFYKDGDWLNQGDIVARIDGTVLTILQAERIALNFISHLSGIATKTASFVAIASGKITILDTRKTLPGYRILQKYAVQCGGGSNHRMGLFDMIMIKDNHIDAAGSITDAVTLVRKKWGSRFKIEVETRNLQEVDEALVCRVDRIMLDNMDDQTMQDAVDRIKGKAEIEASGNMTFERIEEVSNLGGIDFISFGELTHSVTVFDFSLKMKGY